MKKERIMVDGIKYRYIINDSNEIELNKEVSKEVFDRIKEILIKKGKYFEWPEIPYEEIELKERFKKWAKIELKLYKEELEKEKGSEKLIRAIDKEIERRKKNDK